MQLSVLLSVIVVIGFELLSWDIMNVPFENLPVCTAPFLSAAVVIATTPLVASTSEPTGIFDGSVTLTNWFVPGTRTFTTPLTTAALAVLAISGGAAGGNALTPLLQASSERTSERLSK